MFTLYTDRLALRPISRLDWELFLRLYQNPQVMRWIAEPLPDELVEALFEERLASWEKDSINWLTLILEERDSGQTVGLIGLRTDSSRDLRAEVGVLVLPEFQRRRYAGEALQALIHRALAHENYHKLVAVMTAGNEAARQLFESTGFRLDGMLRENSLLGGQWCDDCCYSLLSRDYLTLH
ncbi:GNAT family N-acetyltransferase [Paludibacterium paludis]|uniref:N-acetyltransferase n=1 Tax=Paludibacterium paludis TaxID=1225769 RepID=A0A918P6W8_9NEIS|nr:GNAT family protein [Paludibacterium paludis]GGY28531.1 N-acetyltransferase [Paludibacterium paludis]